MQENVNNELVFVLMIQFLQYDDSGTVVNQALIDAVLEGIVKVKDPLQRDAIAQHIQLVSQV